MAVTLVASLASTREVGGATSRTFTMPTVQTGDIAIISFHAHTSPAATVSGLGWTDQAASQSASRAGAVAYVWTKVLTAADSGQVLTLKSTYVKGVTLCAVYRGATSVLSTPVGSTSSAVAATYNTAAFTPASDKVLVRAVTIGSGDFDVTTATAPTGMTLRQMQGTGGTTAKAGGALADVLTQNAGVSGSWTADASSHWAEVGVELGATAEVALATPVVTVTKVEPSVAGGTGSFTATWSPVPNAVGYKVSTPPLAGNVSTGTPSGEATVSGTTYTWTNQPEGTQTVTVMAV